MSSDTREVREKMVELLPRLRRFARNLTRDPHDADDLVQLGIERALARVDQWRPESRLEGWMFGILRNAWIDEVRARGRHEIAMDPEMLADKAGTTDTTANIDTMSIQTAMARLPEEQRSAVSLVLIEGLSYKEAADAMNVPIGTLTSRLARGRDALSAMLK
jgi:RNA polymerase sigma-70 factor (ECF subfamily)